MSNEKPAAGRPLSEILDELSALCAEHLWPAPWEFTRRFDSDRIEDGNGNVICDFDEDNSKSIRPIPEHMQFMAKACTYLPLLIAVARAAEKFSSHGHFDMTGSCIKDHYPDQQCNCGYELVRKALKALREAGK